MIKKVKKKLTIKLNKGLNFVLGNSVKKPANRLAIIPIEKIQKEYNTTGLNSETNSRLKVLTP